MKVGILGAGQLGRMLAMAAHPLGLEVTLFDDAPDACAADVAKVLPLRGTNYINEVASRADVITYEFENVSAMAAVLEMKGLNVLPPTRALLAADRLEEKQFLASLGIPTTAFEPATEREEFRRAIKRIGYPAVLKTRQFGYDGKGQYRLLSEKDAKAALRAAGERPTILEAFVPFSQELSCIGVRGSDGQTAFYPLIENTHHEGMLRLSVVPAPGVDAALQENAQRYLSAIMDELNYVGVLAVEFFLSEGKLLANEMAPRVHNSGHWTIEGAETSQFENHLRAIAGLPLGSTQLRGRSAMLNLIGSLPPAEELLAVPNAHLHLYGKEPRAGRKLGHVTLRCDDNEEFGTHLATLAAVIARHHGTQTP